MPDEQAQSSTQLRGTVENKNRKPAGLLPKNAQQLVILGVAVVMVLIMWLTGGGKRAASSAPAPPAGARFQPPNAATVEDYKQTIQQQQAATRQPISPSNLERLKALGLAGDVPPDGAAVPPGDASIPQPGGAIGGAAGQQPPPPDPVKEDRKKRQYLSLFAPNVAFTHRKGQEAEQLAGAGPKSSNPPSLDDSAQQRPNNWDAQLREAEAQLAALGQTGQRDTPPPTSASAQQKQSTVESERSNPDVSRPGTFNSFTGKRYAAFESMVLETLFINRLTA